MKNLLFLSLFVLAFSFVSCGDDDGGVEGPGGDDATTFSCQIDGAGFETNGLFAYGVDDDGQMAMYGVEIGDNGRTVYLLVRDGGTTGTYTLGFSTQATAYFTDADGTSYTTFDQAANGTLNVTEKTDERITGTFSATVVDNDGNTVDISGGDFDVEIR